MRKKISLFLLGAAVGLSAFSQEVKRPNILWIVADDMSNELGCYGEPAISTPNLDNLAENGIRYNNCYATAPVCSPSRSALITGMYQVSISSQLHRTVYKHDLPDGVLPVTEYFRKAGYYCTNGNCANMKKAGKGDYNFNYKNMYDGTDWKDKAEGQPFFAQIQSHYPHRPFSRDNENPVDPDKVRIPSCYPDDSISRRDWANYLESIQLFDKEVGRHIQSLKDAGELDNTIIFIFGDNGRPHVRDKQFLYDNGLKVALIVYAPGYFPKKRVSSELVSLIDVTATSMSLAGIEIPDHLQGNVFLGKDAKKRKYIYGMRDRCGDAVDEMRSIFDGRYHLILNRRPEIPYMQMSGYKKIEYPVYTLMHYLYKQGKLTNEQALFMSDKKEPVELYDLKNDSLEFNNLVNVKKYSKIKNKLLSNLNSNLENWEKGMYRETSEEEENAINSSRSYFEHGMKKNKLDPNISNEDYLEFWKKELDVNE